MNNEQCFFCRTGRMEECETTVTLEHGEHIVRIEQVPARVCDSCGESLIRGDVVDRVFKLADEMEESGTSDRTMEVPVKALA
jgi:YgiT-type zinc finger domain-containing protein